MTSGPRKKKIIGGIIIILSLASTDLANEINGGVWELMGDNMCRVACTDEEQYPAAWDAAEALADAVDPSGLSSEDIGTFAADLANQVAKLPA